MKDNYLLLKEPRRLWLEADLLKTKFFALSSEVHPDRIHNAPESEKLAATQRYSELNAAYQCLREPRSRIRHLLELELGAKPSDLTDIPDELMNLFLAVGKEFRDVDTFLAEKAKATSPMVQVQLFESGMERVDQLNNLTRNIFSLRETLLEELKSLDTVWQSGKSHQMDRLLNIWRLLSFYERWLAQIQERTVQLSF
ncbi:MAG: DnaJ domain-containing protein [Verrucomicrobia bacterium]|nr:MAG: DnaJ domain-containing protein [Verrucomicrobiota bacterium]